MTHQLALGVAAVVVTAAGSFVVPPAAHAQPVPPQPGAVCSKEASGALTQLPDRKTLLQCRNQQDGDEYRWQSFESPYPNSDRWLTYGPQLTLHGEGQPNREIDSGDWMAYPQTPEDRCQAEQRAVVSAGELSPPQVVTGEPGQPLKLRLSPLLFTVDLTGYCFWQKEP